MSTRPPLLTVPFALAAAANFLQGLALHSYLHIPGFLADLDAGEEMIGIVFGVMGGAAIVIRPFAGRVMDASGRRTVILAGGVVHIVACALYLTVDAIGPWLFFVRILQGFAQGALFSSLFTYAADIIPPSRRTEGMGLFGISGMLPISLGGLMGDVVLAHAGYRELFLVSMALAILALLASLPLKEPARARTTAGKGFLRAFGQRDLLPLWFVGSSFAAALAGVFAFLKRYVELEGIGSVGLFFSFYAGSAIALRLFFGWLPDRMGAKRALYPSLVAIALALGTLALARSDAWVATAGVLAGLGHRVAFPRRSAMVVDRAAAADRGSAVSLFTAVFDAGILVGAPLLGWVAELTDYRHMFAIAALVPILGALIFAVWDRDVAAPSTVAEP